MYPWSQTKIGPPCVSILINRMGWRMKRICSAGKYTTNWELWTCFWRAKRVGLSIYLRRLNKYICGNKNYTYNYRNTKFQLVASPRVAWSKFENIYHDYLNRKWYNYMLFNFYWLNITFLQNILSFKRSHFLLWDMPAAWYGQILLRKINGSDNDTVLYLTKFMFSYFLLLGSTKNWRF